MKHSIHELITGISIVAATFLWILISCGKALKSVREKKARKTNQKHSTINSSANEVVGQVLLTSSSSPAQKVDLLAFSKECLKSAQNQHESLTLTKAQPHKRKLLAENCLDVIIAVEQRPLVINEITAVEFRSDERMDQKCVSPDYTDHTQLSDADSDIDRQMNDVDVTMFTCRDMSEIDVSTPMEFPHFPGSETFIHFPDSDGDSDLAYHSDEIAPTDTLEAFSSCIFSGS